MQWRQQSILEQPMHIYCTGKGQHTSNISVAVLGDDTADADRLSVQLQLNCARSDTQLFVQPAECVTNDVKLVSQLLHHTVDAGSVFEHIHALGVGVVSNCEGALDGLGKLPEMNTVSSLNNMLLTCILQIFFICCIIVHKLNME